MKCHHGIVLEVERKVEVYTASQCYRLVATNLSISSSSNKSVKIRLVATCHLQTCYNLLKQLAANLWITSFDNQLATSLLTTCNKLVVNKLSQTMRTHSDIGLLMTTLLQDVNKLIETCVFRYVTVSTEYPNCKFFSSTYIKILIRSTVKKCRWELFDLSRLTFCLPLISNLL